MCIGTLDGLIDKSVYRRLEEILKNEEEFEDDYTEHQGRKGKKIGDSEIVQYFDSYVKEKILEQLDVKEALVVSDIYGCIDEKGFMIPYHTDDIYKLISCVLYCGEGFRGTMFLGDRMEKREIVAKENRLLYFTSRDKIHCVPKGDERRYTVQFHYRHK